MKDRYAEYMDIVTRRIYDEEYADSIRCELTDHMNELEASYKSWNYGADEARQKVIESMGDPECLATSYEKAQWRVFLSNVKKHVGQLIDWCFGVAFFYFFVGFFVLGGLLIHIFDVAYKHLYEEPVAQLLFSVGMAVLPYLLFGLLYRHFFLWNKGLYACLIVAIAAFGERVIILLKMEELSLNRLWMVVNTFSNGNASGDAVAPWFTEWYFIWGPFLSWITVYSVFRWKAQKQLLPEFYSE